MKERMQGHTQLYTFKGQYKVMVIPVQFSDTPFVNPQFFEKNAAGKIPAQEYLFGDHPLSMTEYYRHASMGKLHVQGEVMPAVTVPGTLARYGEAIEGASDKDARRLVVDALQQVKAQRPDPRWWSQFDQWDLQDYDGDQHFYEPDGFVDAVVLIYAGKSQASCQRDFDPEVKRPPSAEVPAGPRHDATVECFNRIWPHRWSISIASDDPLHSTEGPLVEGERRPSMNGLKINEELFALDYNMQSEFSDRSTFMHEFGHSLTLPDIYAKAGDNSVGNWELMAGNAGDSPQELSTFSKLSLGGWPLKSLLQAKRPAPI